MRDFQNLPRLGHLRAFDMVAQCGSMLAASERLNISQPAVTYALARLENELRVRLLDRGTAGSFLTPQGRTFQNRTTRLFRQIEMAIAETIGESDRARTAILAWKLREPQVRTLIAIWQNGSFRAAARQLGLAEPTLQRPAREIERLLRTTLYRRTVHGWEANASGVELARRLALALDEIGSGIEEIGAYTSAQRANLRIGVLALSPRMILAETASELLRDQPAQRIDVIDGTYEHLATALRSGDIDAMFGALRRPTPYPDLAEAQLLEDPYTIVCRTGHPLHAAHRIGPTDLARYDFVLPTEGIPRRAVLDRLLAEWRIAPQARIETSCLATIVALLRTSDRLTLLSRWHVDLDGWSDLRRLEQMDVSHPARFVGLTMRQDWLPTPFQQRFIDALGASVRRWKERAA